MTPTVEIRREATDSPAALAMIRELNESLWERYPDMPKADADQYKQGNRLAGDTPFFVAYRDGEPVGCGCYRPMSPSTVEIKRMYVKSTMRRLGLGRAILEHIEEMARRAGYRVARLETGTAQTEALALYERDGYRRIPCWPPYDQLPISICMEKAIG